jgi:TolB-like protein/tetratricopeptide (TPR) repeat protein
MPTPLDRLKKRKMAEWCLAYLAGAWLLMQLVEVLAGRWPVPLGLQQGTDLLLLVGLFVTLTLAWYHGEKGRQRVTGPELLILAALLFVGGVMLTLLKSSDRPAEATLESTPAPPLPAPAGTVGVAVLPLRNLSGDSEQDYFVAGMHEALINSLSRIQDLRVISRTSVMRYAGTDRTIPEIASVLGVDAVIEGSVNPVGDRVRITVQLIDGRSDAHIWAEDYDRDLRDVLVLMHEVAQSVTERVEVALAPEGADLPGFVRPVDPELYDLYLRGRYLFGRFTAEGLARSAEYFDQALRVDSTFAMAWAGLSGSHIMAAYLGFVPAQRGLDQADRSARRALELDGDLSLAHTALGWVLFYKWDWEGAGREFARALELNPNDVDALHGFGDYLTVTGSPGDGLIYVKRARDNDPFSPIWGHSVVGHLLMMDRFEEAIAEAERVLELYPESSVQGLKGAAYWQLGRTEEAIAQFRVSLAGRTGLLSALEEGYASGGPIDGARAAAEVAAETVTGSGRSALGVAFWFGRAGDGAETLAWLERAFEKQAPDLAYIGVRPEVDFLHSDPSFLVLLERMGLPAPGGAGG